MYKMTFRKKQKCVYCKKKQLICFTCASCNQCYCMQHKMPELHECPCDFKNKDSLKIEPLIALKVDKI